MISGLRNERARQRHRQRKKEACGCTSLPASVVASESSRMHLEGIRLSESNHFGWSVCGKCGNDPEFERRLQTKEKPDLQGRDDNASTYVLCIEEGTLRAPSKPPRSPVRDLDERQIGPREPPFEGPHEPPYEGLPEPPYRDPHKIPKGPKLTKDDRGYVKEKATQTSIQGIVQELDDKEKKDKKKKLISEFFYTPLQSRSRSRSPSTGKSKPKLLGQLTDEPRVYLDRKSKQKIDKKKVKSKKDSVKKKADKKRKKSKKSFDDKRDVMNDIDENGEEVKKDIDKYEKKARKGSKEKKRVTIGDIEDDGYTDAARRAVSDSEQSFSSGKGKKDKKKRKPLGSGKVFPKKNKSKNRNLRAGSDSSRSAKTVSVTEGESSKSSIVYHLEPVRPKKSSSEHLLSTSGANRYPHHKRRG